MTDQADKALSFVGQINAAYANAEKAGASALSYALECGKYLNLAKENVEEAEGKWKQWREKNLPTVSEETERVYRRLADAVAKKEDFFVKCKSIRAALEHLGKYEEKDGELVLKPKTARTPRPKTGTGSTATGLEPPEADTPSGLAAELENAAADEIIKSIEDDTDKLAEVAQRSIAKLTPDKVCDALTKAWPREQLRELVKLVTTHIADTVPASDIPSTLRRAPGQPARPAN